MGPLRLLVFVLAITVATSDTDGDDCPLRPTGGASAQPRPGDGGHRLTLAGTPERFVPGSTYTLSLESAPGRPFRQFVLTVSAWRGDKQAAEDTRRWPGSFQLFPASPDSASAAQFSDDCINAVVHDAAQLPQRQVQVMWRAPMTSPGCVVFRAMVLESPDNWYAGEGQLEKVLCELPLSTTPLPLDDDTEQECCACSEAKYKLVFQGLWTKETHPKDFPTSLWLMHFSDVLGASHEKNFSFWGEGQVATDGFRQLAEWGSVGWLERELRAKGRHLRTLFKAAGLWHPRVNANTSATFRVDRKKHLLSLASMIGPSPDWVVGVSGMDLCKKDCTWIEHAQVDLFPYDAGTDSGISYMSPNAPTVPRERMYKITPMYPEDPRAPFYDPTGRNPIKPMARLYLVRESERQLPCDEERDDALSAENTENTEDGERPECVVDQWSPWSPCSVSCGKGLRMRFRSYQMAAKAEMLGCDRQLVSKEFCSASLPSCPGDPDEGNIEATPGMTESGAGVFQEENSVNALPDDACDTTPWSPWSSCSSSCGSGVQTRSRSFVNPQGLKKCPHVPNKEYQPCTGPPCEQVEYVDPACVLTDWSDWSPCSVSCGRGLKHRTRFSLAADPAVRSRCEASTELRQTRSCSIQADCGLNRSQAAEVCTQPPLPGPCRAYFERFYFEPTTRRCLPFGYGGCRGNRNNFKLREQCEDFCQPLRDGQIDIPKTTGSTPSVDVDGPVVDCQLTSWSEWSQCSAVCGPGFTSRHRTVVVEGRNGGVVCPTKLTERRRCNAGPCDPFS